MKAITAKDAINGSVDTEVTDDDIVQFNIDTEKARQFDIRDQVLVLGFKQYGYEDGLSVFKGSRDLPRQVTIVRFDRKYD